MVGVRRYGGVATEDERDGGEGTMTADCVDDEAVAAHCDILHANAKRYMKVNYANVSSILLPFWGFFVNINPTLLRNSQKLYLCSLITIPAT